MIEYFYKGYKFYFSLLLCFVAFGRFANLIYICSNSYSKIKHLLLWVFNLDMFMPFVGNSGSSSDTGKKREIKLLGSSEALLEGIPS
jgi:hypothetical protein